jgi:hypothetical protein
MRFYSTPSREMETYALPDCEVFQLTAAEVAEQDEDLIYEYGRRHEFRLWSMNSATREKMIDAIIEEQGITGGWFYWFCFPGCLPDSQPMGPFASRDEAIEACRDEWSDDAEVTP